MADLIDRAALLEDLEAAESNAGMGYVVARTLMRYVKRCPTIVDAVEVVRCKDCKKSGMYAFRNDATERLACLDIDESGFIEMATSVEPMDFCSHGERRIDGDLP